MAIKVKDAAASATKFTQNAGVAQGAYSAGVQSAGPSWQANTAAAADTWSLGVQQAAQSGRFAAGVNPTSMAKYQTRATTVGPSRYSAGVQTAGPAWQAGTQPYLTTIANLNLPPRQPKGSPANAQRSAMVAAALRSKKVGTS